MQKFEAATELFLVSENCHQDLKADTRTCAQHRLLSLLEAVSRGDGDAFNQLYKLYAPMVHGILLARVPPKDVDDLVQEVFITVHTKLKSLREPLAFGGWLSTLARNHAHDFHRRSHATEEIPQSLASPRAPHSAIDAAEIMAVIRALPDAYSETLTLRLVEGLTGPEIAELTGLTPASVRVNLSRGMKLLREKLRMEKKV